MIDQTLLTAYALGEATPAQIKAVKKAIKQDPSLKAEIQAIQEMASLLGESLQHEPLPKLTAKQRARILGQRPLWLTYAGLAAALLICIIVWQYVGTQSLPEPIPTTPPAEVQSGDVVLPNGQVVPLEQVVGQPELVPLDEVPEEILRDHQVDNTLHQAANKKPPAVPKPRLSSQPHHSHKYEQNTIIEYNESMEVIQKDYGIGITDAPCAIAKSYPSEPSVDESYLNEENRDGDVDPNVLDRKEAKADERRKFQLGKLKEEWLTQQQAYLNLPSPERKMAIQQIETKINQLRDELGWSNTESYAVIAENPFLDPQHDPLSTFSIDVDTASYSNLRRFLNQGQLPPPGAIRIEELINYFDYAYPTPDPGQPFSASVEVTSAPWNEAHRIARIGLKGYEVDPASRPACNLVFLVDVSGSMENPNKLPLVQSSLTKLVNHLRGDDSVALVVYAGSSGTLLDPTPVSQKATIVQAIQQLSAGGSTQGSAGIEAAYALAQSAFKKDGINRIILATDGDFNVGISDNSSLEKLISEKAKGGVFLTVLGFGMGNYQDSTLELLADKGNGFYAYIDSEVEADKVMVHQLTGTLMTIAKDVKIQVEFNPQAVSSYRLIGYENRKMAARDFNDDSKDAGEIGAGHTVTALYEIVPVDQASKAGSIDPLKYQAQAEPTADAFSNELLTVKIRYKKPDSDTSQLLSFPVSDSYQKLEETSADTQFALAVACFGLNLRGSAIQTPWPKVQKWLKASSTDPLRLEFQTLVEKAIALQ